MDQREVKVDCPCCQSRLEVDVRTGTVVKWRPESKLDATGKPVVSEADWSGAADRVRTRNEAAADKFDAHLNREKGRGRDLDDLFKQANERLRKPADDAE